RAAQGQRHRRELAQPDREPAQPLPGYRLSGVCLSRCCGICLAAGSPPAGPGAPPRTARPYPTPRPRAPPPGPPAPPPPRPRRARRDVGVHSRPLEVADAQVELGPGELLLGRLAEPAGRFFGVLLDAQAEGVADAQVALRLGLPLVGRLAEPAGRFRLVLVR